MGQITQRYQGKYFSIFGDSISTLEGCNPVGYSVFYTGLNCKRARVYTVEDTWWGQVIQQLGGQLLVNNAWSGSRVSQTPGREGLFPAGCSDERTSSLHTGTAAPDVIIVYLGINDYIGGCGGRSLTRSLFCSDMHYFGDAYFAMLEKLTRHYPQAEIWCCTLAPSSIAAYPEFVFPAEYEGRSAERFNDEIRAAACHFGCRLLDLYAAQTPYDSIDGTHPTRAGMATLARIMLDCIGGDKA